MTSEIDELKEAQGLLKSWHENVALQEHFMGGGPDTLNSVIWGTLTDTTGVFGFIDEAVRLWEYTPSDLDVFDTEIHLARKINALNRRHRVVFEAGGYEDCECPIGHLHRTGDTA